MEPRERETRETLGTRHWKSTFFWIHHPTCSGYVKKSWGVFDDVLDELSTYVSLFIFLGVPTNESPESKTCSSAKVSGLQRSQEQSNSEVPFTPPVPSPTPASAPTGSPAPAAAAAPPEPPRLRLPTPPPLSVKREQQPPPPIPTPPLLRAPPHPQSHPPHPHSHQEPCILPPPKHHTRPVISHQLHHPLQCNNLHDIR